jgi:hypothetical protein
VGRGSDKINCDRIACRKDHLKCLVKTSIERQFGLGEARFGSIHPSIQLFAIITDVIQAIKFHRFPAEGTTALGSAGQQLRCPLLGRLPPKRPVVPLLT